MGKYREVYNAMISPEKQEEDRKYLFLTSIIRPLSVLISMPLIKTRVTATTITKISVLASCIGFGFLAFGKSVVMQVLGWCFFFVWVILDCVDGNLARYKKQASAMGEVWDAFGGYVAMVLTYFGIGIASFYSDNLIMFCEPYWLLILGGATSIIAILPRLMMHKKRASFCTKEINRELTNKRSFSLIGIVAANVFSLVGPFQGLFLVCILCRLLNLFLGFYFLANLGMMAISLYSLLKE